MQYWQSAEGVDALVSLSLVRFEGCRRWVVFHDWRYKMRRFVIAVFFIVFVLSLDSRFAQCDDGYGEQIGAMYPVWKQYLHTLRHVQCTIERSEHEGNAVTSKMEAFFDVDFPCVLGLATNGKRVDVYNEKYSFALTRTDADGEWTLAQLEKNDKRPSLDSWDFLPITINISQAQNSYNMVAGLTTAGLRLFPIWFPSLTMSDDFHVLGIERKTEDGLNVVIIKYRFEPDNQSLINSNRSGEVTLLEDHYYLIKRAKFEYIYNLNPEKRGVADVSNSYDFGSDFSVPIITSQETRFVENGQEYGKIETFSDYQIPKDTDKKRFMLSHYGFPEPDFGERPIGWARFLLIAVGVLLIIFALGRRLISK